MIKREWEVDLDQNTCELGWKFETCDELGEAYYTITTEGTLHNALSVMHNSIRTTNSPAIMRLSLWSPIPSDPPFAPSRRAAEVARRRPKAMASTSGASARSPPATANQLVEADVELRDNSRLPTPEQIVYTPPAAPTQFVLPPALPATELNKQHDVLPVIPDQLRTSRQQLRQEEERQEEERQEEQRQEEECQEEQHQEEQRHDEQRQEEQRPEEDNGVQINDVLNKSGNVLEDEPQEKDYDGDAAAFREAWNRYEDSRLNHDLQS